MNIEHSIRATLSIICIGVFAAGASIAQSANTNDAYLEACRGDVEAYDGEERELAIVKKATSSGGHATDTVCEERQRQRRIRQLLGAQQPQRY